MTAKEKFSKTREELKIELERNKRLIDEFMKEADIERGRIKLEEFKASCARLTDLKVQFKEDLTAWNEKEK